MAAPNITDKEHIDMLLEIIRAQRAQIKAGVDTESVYMEKVAALRYVEDAFRHFWRFYDIERNNLNLFIQHMQGRLPYPVSELPSMEEIFMGGDDLERALDKIKTPVSFYVSERMTVDDFNAAKILSEGVSVEDD